MYVIGIFTYFSLNLLTSWPSCKFWDFIASDVEKYSQFADDTILFTTGKESELLNLVTIIQKIVVCLGQKLIMKECYCVNWHGWRTITNYCNGRGLWNWYVALDLFEAFWILRLTNWSKRESWISCGKDASKEKKIIWLIENLHLK